MARNCGQRGKAMKRDTLSERISFRVKDEDWERIEDDAIPKGISVHDWCRDAALEKVEKLRNGVEKDRPKETENGGGVVINNPFLYSEIASLRYLLGNAFGLLSTGELTVDKWNEIVREADKNAAEIAKSLLEKRQAKGQAK
jgi:hypothetical protein